METWIRWADSHAGDVPDGRMTTIAALRIVDLVMALHPGEVFVEDGPALQTAFPDHPVIPVGYANDAPGYILTTMLHLHKGRGANLAIYLASAVVFVGSPWLVRSQTPVGQVPYMKAYIAEFEGE